MSGRTKVTDLWTTNQLYIAVDKVHTHMSTYEYQLHQTYIWYIIPSNLYLVHFRVVWYGGFTTFVRTQISKKIEVLAKWGAQRMSTRIRVIWEWSHITASMNDLECNERSEENQSESPLHSPERTPVVNSPNLPDQQNRTKNFPSFVVFTTIVNCEWFWWCYWTFLTNIELIFTS